MSIDMTCALFAFHSQQVKQSAYDNLPPLLTTPFSSLVMNMLVLDLRPVWRWEGCWQRRSFRERCVRQHFQVRRHLRQYRRPVVGLFLLPGSEGRDGLGVQVGQWNGETAEDGVVSDSVCNPLILSLQRSRDLAGGGELIGRRSVLQHLEEEVEQATVLGHLCRLSIPHAAKLGLLGCSGLGRVRPKAPTEQGVAPPGLVLLDEAGGGLVVVVERAGGGGDLLPEVSRH